MKSVKSCDIILLPSASASGIKNDVTLVPGFHYNSQLMQQHCRTDLFYNHKEFL